ncbi:MAG TPA: hypothetical protein VD706_00195 [Candidatus Saccharimonadales bacterium]|nr:hypothetical protein [Candidatus Saccharimonadales bacterium]
MSEQDPFSSTGHPGVPELRADERYYLNAAQYFSDAPELIQTWEGLRRDAASQPENPSRVVLRTIVSDAVLAEMRSVPYSHLLEVAVPLGHELGRGDSNLVYLGQNDPGRQPLVPIEQIKAETASSRAMKKAPEQRIHDAIDAGTTITTTVSPEDYQGLHELWEKFGWVRDETRDQVAEFAQALEADQAYAKNFGPETRKLWFSGVRHEGQLVAAAMGERLPLQDREGEIDLVESTEWSVKAGHNRNGYVAAALVALNAQILHDLESSPNGRPLIFAECNFMNRADLTGNSVGMAIPSRAYADQILPQNVTVADGKEPPGLRDFNLMILPRSIQETYYTPAQNARMLSTIMVNSKQA